MSVNVFLIIALTPLVGCYNVDISNPVVYILPGSGKLNYFGYSVVTRPNAASFMDSWVFQVSAPRANVTGVRVYEPGAIFRCGLYSCKEFVVDDNNNAPGIYYYYRYKDRRNEAWTGVSMDIKYANSIGKTVICGNRWANQNLTNDDRVALTYLMTGVCYLQDISNRGGEYPVHKLLPLVNSDRIYYPKPHDSQKSFYYWGLGQSGTSSVLLDDLSAVIMGAPGYHNWLGTVIRYNTATSWYDFKVGLFEATKEFKTNAYSYIGYQVSFGRFFSDKKLWLLAGAPRAGNYHGKVLIFQFKDSSNQIHIASELVGSTFGEYFGSVMAVLDINNDGFDDIVVGAPLFFHKHPEEGRIYVYLGNNRGNFLYRSQVINGRHPYSRFGSCIANLGDLDQDSFKDVAVGAPYENNGMGAVYIYRGSKKGLDIEYSQRIAAEDVGYGLRGFGISISGSVDIDGNRFNDLVIGSYLSDRVVLLRSRPIVYLHPVIRLEDIVLLDRKAESFNMTICLRYSGANAPETINVNRTIEADLKGARATIRTSGSAAEKKSVSLSLNEVICEVSPIDVKHDSTNFEPIRLLVRAELPGCTEKSVTFVTNPVHSIEDKFDKWCPIGRKREAFIEVPYAGECGANNVCEAELYLTCTILDRKKSAYLIVTSQYITLSLDLKNFGEPAHGTEIMIESNIDLVAAENMDDKTEQVTKRVFYIDVGSTFLKNFKANFSFRIATESYNATEMSDTHLRLRVEARTRSVEDFVGDNVCDISFSLLSDANVDLFASSSGINAFDMKNTSSLNFTLYYEVQKKGETPVTDAELNIYIPSFLEVDVGEVEFSSFTVETSDWIYSSVNDEKHSRGEGPSEVDIMWHNLNSSNASLPISRTVFLNCSTGGIRCRTVSIVFPDGIPAQKSSHIKIIINLNTTAIGSMMQDKDIIHFTSGGVLEYQKLFEADPVLTFSHSSVTFYKEEELKMVEPYVIALSVIAGGLLLILIIYGLVKSEFFRRKKKEELEALKTEELKRQSDYEFPPEAIDVTKENEECD